MVTWTCSVLYSVYFMWVQFLMTYKMNSVVAHPRSLPRCKLVFPFALGWQMVLMFYTLPTIFVQFSSGWYNESLYRYFLDVSGALEFSNKGVPSSLPEKTMPFLCLLYYFSVILVRSGSRARKNRGKLEIRTVPSHCTLLTKNPLKYLSITKAFQLANIIFLVKNCGHGLVYKCFVVFLSQWLPVVILFHLFGTSRCFD